MPVGVMISRLPCRWQRWWSSFIVIIQVWIMIILPFDIVQVSFVTATTPIAATTTSSTAFNIPIHYEPQTSVADRVRFVVLLLFLCCVVIFLYTHQSSRAPHVGLLYCGSFSAPILYLIFPNQYPSLPAFPCLYLFTRCIHKKRLSLSRTPYSTFLCRLVSTQI